MDDRDSNQSIVSCCISGKEYKAKSDTGGSLAL
uniref:Uncharacterized protein n=1 Tax=Arundo donax TaxID=35708 RepID=A0A0A9GAT5_ARUDO